MQQKNEEQKGSADEREAYLAEIASELKEVNTSLRAIARSQAQQAALKRPRQNS